MTDKEINALFDKFIAENRAGIFASAETAAEVVRQLELVDQICETALQRMDGEAIEAIPEIINSQNITPQLATGIFTGINYGLLHTPIEDGNEEFSFVLKSVSSTLERVAINYHTNQIDRELEGNDLISKLRKIKRKILDIKYSVSTAFQLQALNLFKERIEKEISEIKEDKEDDSLRQEIDQTSSENQKFKKALPEAKHIESRNLNQVFLVLRILLSDSNKPDTEKGKIMSFLSGYSGESLRNSYSQYKNWDNKKTDFKIATSWFNRMKISTPRMIQEFQELQRECSK